FDEFLERYPLTSRLADGVYRFLQWLDKSHHVARQAKRSSKTFLRCVSKVQDKSIEHARRLACDVVCCGHTHHPVALKLGPVHYFNSGPWTERPCHYLTISAGAIELRTCHEEATSDPIPDQALAGALS